MSADDVTRDLRRALAEVAERVVRYRESPIGEQNTKVSLIMPVLRALGWEVEDLDEVRLEYRRKPADKPVDYALMLQREPVLFLEAKGLGENLDDRRWASQIISYAAVAGVEWVALTNGDAYRIYNAHAPVPVEEKLFRSVRIDGDLDEAEEALRLLSKHEVRRKSLGELWRAHSIDSRVRRAVQDLFAPEADPWLVRRLARDLEGLTQGDVKTALGRARISLDFPAAEPAASDEERKARPAAAARPVRRSGDERSRPASYDVDVADLLEAGLIPSGAVLRKTYLGQEVTARVEPDGRIRFGSQIYKSLSTAAGAARVSVKGPPPGGRRYYQTNGWTFWEFEEKAGNWQEMQALRERFLSERVSDVPES
jgi:hypothetical protein